MRLNLKLFQQGLILVGVPVGLMLIFLVSLLVLFLKVEQEAKETDRSKTIIAKANSLVKEYYDAASQLMIYKYTRSDKVKGQFETQLAGTENSFGELRDLLQDNAQELQMLSELKAVAEH